jgi:Zn-finger nucleic acid-binding protein
VSGAAHHAGAHAISCPKDGEVMSRIRVGTVEIDRCPTCGGVWLDRGELDGVRKLGAMGTRSIEALDGVPSVEPAERPQPLLCPRDRSRMSVHRDPGQKHVEYDTCTKCGGVFLDAGELADLTELTLGERLRGMLG